MKLLLTGANGLVGSHLLPLLLANGHELTILVRKNSRLHLIQDHLGKVKQVEGDLNDIVSLEKAVENTDAILHAAAFVSFSPNDKDRLFEANYEGTRNLVNVALECPTCKSFLYVSSIATIDIKIKPGRVESQQEEKQLSNYAISKHYGELEVFRAREEGMNTAMVNPTFILGPGKWGESSTKVFNYVLEGKRFYTKGTVNFVDARDVAKACLVLVERLHQNNKTRNLEERVILNAGHISFQGLFTKIAKAFGKKAPSIALPRFVMELLWREEMVRSAFTGSSPIMNRYSAKNAYSKRKHPVTDCFYYELPEFHSVDEAVGYTAEQMKKLYKL